jgi:hypothetical protein
VSRKYVGKWVRCKEDFPFRLVGPGATTVGEDDCVSVESIFAILDAWERAGKRTLDGMWSDGCAMSKTEWNVLDAKLNPTSD